MNAVEKARALKSSSFVTWNSKQAIIWGVDTYDYSVESLIELAKSKPIRTVNSREDITDPEKYRDNLSALEETLDWILHSLGDLFVTGRIRPALNISSYYIDAVTDAAKIIIPSLENDIKIRTKRDRNFKQKYFEWKILEKQTLSILRNSSRSVSSISSERVLARFTYYKIIGKILFYLSLSENLSGRLRPLIIDNPKNTYQEVESFFSDAKAIDYQALFNEDFTDKIEFNESANLGLFKLIEVFTTVSFRLLPSEVIGNILENLVPVRERQKFGQYFTPPKLAALVALSALEYDMEYVIDPTSGTGTFLSIIYNYFKYGLDELNHNDILEKVWGNDISHFPSVLSVINLYKQNPQEVNNFPRVLRENFMNLMPNQNVELPNPIDFKEKLTEQLPSFDAIIGNFPFIQQEDIPSKVLNQDFSRIFRGEQQSLLNKKGEVDIPKRSDYFVYCFFQSYIHLADEGRIAAITSNAWLGKEYAEKFKKFILDNFVVKYIVKSDYEHWFVDSQVTTIFTTLEKKSDENQDINAKFVTLTGSLDSFVPDLSNETYESLDQLYYSIDTCELLHDGWTESSPSVFVNSEKQLRVVSVSQSKLEEASKNNDNWKQFFTSTSEIEKYREITIPSPNSHVTGYRGGKTECNEMFIIKAESVESSGIDSKFLVPLLKSPSQVKDYISDESIIEHYQFVCNVSEDILLQDFPKTLKWIKRFENKLNNNGSKTIKETCRNYKPYWYSFKPKYANIVTALNPEQRLFYSYFPNKVAIDQRLIAVNVTNKERQDLIGALYNFTYTLYIMELQGVARYLGALDLNSNIVKTMSILNPEIPTDIQADKILAAYKKVSGREVKPILDEIKMDDRNKFDKTICEVYCLNINLNEIYSKLQRLVTDRLKNKNAASNTTAPSID